MRLPALENPPIPMPPPLRSTAAKNACFHFYGQNYKDVIVIKNKIYTPLALKAVTKCN